MSPLEAIASAVLNGQDEEIPDLIREALAAGLPAGQILNEGLLAGMAEVGRRFRENECFIPEVLVAAMAMKEGIKVLQPHLTRQGVRPVATAAIGTVKGDLHDIGKNIVATMLQGAGFEVIDLGVDVPAERFVDACRTRPVQLVAISALLTTTMPQMAHVVSLLRRELDPCPRIIIGGSPVTQAYADEIGADGYGRDAATGAEVARKLCLVGGSR